MERKGKTEHVLIRILLKHMDIGEEISTNQIIDKFSKRKWCPRAGGISFILSSSERFLKVRTENVNLTVEDDSFEPIVFRRVLKNIVFKRVY